jgi:hypothetical protein
MLHVRTIVPYSLSSLARVGTRVGRSKHARNVSAVRHPVAVEMEAELTEEELLAEAIRLSQETAAAEAAGTVDDESPSPAPAPAASSPGSPALLPSPFALPSHSGGDPVELPPAQQKIVDTLVAMSFPLEAARQAVVLSSATDLQHALSTLLGEPQAVPGGPTGPMLGAAAAAAATPAEQMLGQEEDEMTQEELLRMFGLQASIQKMQADGGEDGFWAAKS